MFSVGMSEWKTINAYGSIQIIEQDLAEIILRIHEEKQEVITSSTSSSCREQQQIRTDSSLQAIKSDPSGRDSRLRVIQPYILQISVIVSLLNKTKSNFQTNQSFYACILL